MHIYGHRKRQENGNMNNNAGLKANGNVDDEKARLAFSENQYELKEKLATL